MAVKKTREQSAVDLLNLASKYRDKPLTHNIIKEMHCCIYEGENAGVYVGNMAIISRNRRGEETVEDRGLPKEHVEAGIQEFIDFYNNAPASTPLYNALRGHIHFESIHPFDDGNGRVGRTIMNMGLMRDLGIQVPLALSRSLHAHSKEYYRMFGESSLDLTQRVKDLAPLFKEAIQETESMLELTTLRKRAYQIGMNGRQEKVFEHLCTAELEGGCQGKFTNHK